MNRFVASFMLPAFLLACGGGSNPFDPATGATTGGTTGGSTGGTTGGTTGGGTPTGATSGIPEVLANNVTSLSIDPETSNLTVEGVTFDDSTFTASYSRTDSLDRDGYLAYTAQDSALDRHFTGFSRQSTDDGVRGGVVLSGGPRNAVFGGAYYEQNGDYTPATGIVRYTGSYVGLVNIPFRDGTATDGDWTDGANIGDLLPVPDGTDVELVPDQAGIIEADISITADFGQNPMVEGNIFNRRLKNPATDGSVLVLPSLVFVGTAIDDNGTFAGDVQYDQSVVPDANGAKIGDFGGTFGGQNASGVAGAVKLDEFDGPNDPDGLENEEEYGVFVLDQDP